MTASKQIKTYKERQIHGTVLMEPSGVILILTTDDNGNQIREKRDPQNSQQIRGGWINIPILDRKGRFTRIDIDWLELFTLTFPELPAPQALTEVKNSETTAFKPTFKAEQDSLF